MCAWVFVVVRCVFEVCVFLRECVWECACLSVCVRGCLCLCLCALRVCVCRCVGVGMGGCKRVCV